MVSINSSAKNLWSIIGQAQERKSAIAAAKTATSTPTFDEKSKAQEELQQKVERAQSRLESYYWQKAQLEELSRPETKADYVARGLMTGERYEEDKEALRRSIENFEKAVADGGPQIFAKGELNGPLFTLGADGFYTVGGVTATGPYGIKIDIPVSREGYEAGQEYIRSIESRAAERTEGDVARATEGLKGSIMIMQAVVRRHNDLVVSLQPERMDALRQTQGDAAVQEYQDAARLALADVSKKIATLNNLDKLPESTLSLSGQPLVKGNDGLYQFGEFTLGTKVVQVTAQVDQTGLIKVARDGENFQLEGNIGAGRFVVEGRDEILAKDQAYFDRLVKLHLKNDEVTKVTADQYEEPLDWTV